MWSSRVATLVACLLVLSCGFHLRGDAPMGLKTLHVSAAAGSQVAVDIRRTLAATPTRVVRNPADAEAQLRILTESRDKTIYTITGAGRVYEFQLRLVVTYQLDVPGSDAPLIPVSEIDVRRVLTYDERAPLAKEAEEVILYRDMVADAAGQILRRIAIKRRES